MKRRDLIRHLRRHLALALQPPAEMAAPRVKELREPEIAAAVCCSAGFGRRRYLWTNRLYRLS